MARSKKSDPVHSIDAYEHRDKQRVNNPPVGLVTPDTDPDAGAQRRYAYDPHMDPQLQWAGKTEHTSFEVPTVSLHVHERIDPRTIIEAARRQPDPTAETQLSLFSQPAQNPPLREAVDFYKHAHGWSNRLVAGDSLLVMNSLLEKEGMAGKVQMIYIDPPYGIRYGSNFQPFVNRRDVKDGKDEDLTAEPEQIRAFRDTWELGIHSYLTYLRDRLLLARELLTESGSVFVQISDENVHHIRALMDEVFGPTNFVSLVTVAKTTSSSSDGLAGVGDYLVWYAVNRNRIKYYQLYLDKSAGDKGATGYTKLRLPNGGIRPLLQAEVDDPASIPVGSHICATGDLTSQRPPGDFPVEYLGRVFRPVKGYWKTGVEGMQRLIEQDRIHATSGNRLAYIRYLDDFPAFPITNIWSDTVGQNQFGGDKVYAVQTALKVVARCVLMTTDPGDLVLDPTCGSGTTAFVAEQWGRRWITCDTSRVALALTRQRLMTATYNYYQLAHPQEGIGSGFVYKTVPHITLKSIANNEPPGTETLYDQPLVDKARRRVSGPFTVEAVPAPAVKSVEDLLTPGGDASMVASAADASVARSGETLRQSEWRDELLRTGIRGKAGQFIRFARIEPLPGCRWLHADGETRVTDEGPLSIREDGAGMAGERVVVSFGPAHAPLEQRQVEKAIEEAQKLVPRPKLIAFAAFQFDPEAAKDIDDTNWPGVTLLKVQMNADLLTDDLKKKRASNQSFWLIGQPDVGVATLREGADAGKLQVTVRGFDYYNTRSGDIESGDARQIAIWLLDTDYDGRSLYPRQVFFPMAAENEGWSKLARNLKAELDEDLIEAYRGTQSLPFTPGLHRRIAVKIVDDRGIESLRVMELE
ncbi:MAG: site-specific DNA-methyltransferase [Anaerolineae bacterium]